MAALYVYCALSGVSTVWVVRVGDISWTPSETWRFARACDSKGQQRWRRRWRSSQDFGTLKERLREISADGDPLETLAEAVYFERFRPILEAAAGRAPGPKGGRPALDVVLKFRMLVLQSLRGLSLAATEAMVRDRPGWMRFCGIELCDKVPDANTLRGFREALIKADALDRLFRELDRAISEAGCTPRSGRIVDASLVAAPRQRNSAGEKAAIKAGKAAGEIRPGEPAKAARKDTDARWIVKHSKAKPKPDGGRQTDIAIPVFGCKSHICIDRKHGIIRCQTVTDASAHDGARLREGLVQGDNTCRDVWADTASRSAENEEWLERNGLKSRIHRRKPRGRPTSRRTAKANGRKSAARAKVEHVFAHRKARMGLTVRTIGVASARAAITMANMACNMGRLRWLPGRVEPA